MTCDPAVDELARRRWQQQLHVWLVTPATAEQAADLLAAPHQASRPF